MPGIRPAPKLLVAVFSMAAIMLGALEHESLLFQAPVASLHPASSPAPDPLATGAGADWSRIALDAGTEGTFRSEPDGLPAAPARSFVLTWRITSIAPAHASEEAPAHLRPPARLRRSDALPLRI